MKSHKRLAQDPCTWKGEGFALCTSISSCRTATHCGKLQTSNFILKHFVGLQELDLVNRLCKTFLRNTHVKLSQTHKLIGRLSLIQGKGELVLPGNFEITFFKRRYPEKSS